METWEAFAARRSSILLELGVVLALLHFIVRFLYTTEL
jgi:hypothetical protein